MTFHRFLGAACVCSCYGLIAVAQTTADAQKIFDRTLTGAEKEFLALAAAMPADKYGFAPTEGKFDGVRTFGLQVRHVAYVLNEIASTMLGEAAPPTAANENGPDSLETKDQILAYAKDAFAHAHRAVAQMTNANLLEQTTDPFNPKGKRARIDSAGIMVWHTFDHYGQMVVYARMNGVVPPGSR